MTTPKRNAHRSLWFRCVLALSAALVGSGCATTVTPLSADVAAGERPLPYPSVAPADDGFTDALAELSDLRERLSIREQLRAEQQPEPAATVKTSSRKAPTRSVTRPAAPAKQAQVTKASKPKTPTGFQPAACAADDPNRWDPLNGCL